MIEHRPGDWQRTDDEAVAVTQIDEAIEEIKKASIDDGKDLADHPQVDEKAAFARSGGFSKESPQGCGPR